MPDIERNPLWEKKPLPYKNILQKASGTAPGAFFYIF